MSGRSPILDEYYERYKDDPEYILEVLYLEITEQLLAHMDEEGVSQAELASRLGVSEARVSHVFSETQNLTLRTIAKWVAALHAQVDVNVRNRAEPVAAARDLPVETDRRQRDADLAEVLEVVGGVVQAKALSADGVVDDESGTLLRAA